MSETQAQLQAIFRDLFEDDSIVLREETTADDIEGWDSLAHINLIIAVERAFKIKLATSEISEMKNPGENVGSFIRLIDRKRSRS